MPDRLLRAILRDARAHRPRECCGLLVARGDRVESHLPLRNATSAPAAFSIDALDCAAAEQRLRRTGRRPAGVYHSHPFGPPHPSRRDRDLLWGEHAGWQLIVTPGGAWALWQPTRGPWRLLQQGAL